MPCFQITALPATHFSDLPQLDPAQRRARGVTEVVATSHPGFPCRVSLEDAAVGEVLYLLHHVHVDAHSPFHAGGPIFVRRDAVEAQVGADEIPALLRHRTLSLRAYDAAAHVIAAELCPGHEAATALQRLFADPRITEVHLHNAQRGCFLCAARRVVDATSA